jgi:uracil-DNA glycosylase
VDKTKHCILRSVHPSPLSAARGFFECKHFIKSNEWLRNKYGVEGEVEWDCLAEGKQGKGLPVGETGKKELVDKAATAVLVTGSIQKVASGAESASVEEMVAAKDGKDNVTIEDAYEFDDELDRVASA